MARKLPIGSKIGKVWGWTKALFQSDTTEVQVLQVEAGYVCSEHRHAHKNNLFYVIRGRIKVVTWKDGLRDESVLEEGEMTVVKAGDWHQFEAVTNSQLIELYWATLDPDDIERRSHGGRVEKDEHKGPAT